MQRILLLLMMTLCLAFSSTVQARSLFVVTLYSPPLAFERDGEVVGIAADVVREGLKRMGVQARISIMPWKRAVFMTRFGEADALFYAVRNAEREEWFHYPDEPLVEESTIALRQAGSSVRIAPDRFEYPDYSLGIGRGFYYGPRLKAFLDKARFRKVEEAVTTDSNFSKLIEGRVNVILADLYLARHFMRKRASRGLVEMIADEQGAPIIFDSVHSYLAFSRESTDADVARHFSRILQDMKTDGTYDRIVNRYQ